MAASGECSACHEVIVVQGASSRPEHLSAMLLQAFEEHIRSVDLSEKAIGVSGILD